MAQGDDEQHNPLHNAGSLYDDDMEDSTMEISLKDIYALSKVDQAQKEASSEVSGEFLTNMSPPPAPTGQDHQTVEIEDDLIELDGEVLDELTSEVYDEQDYDLVHRNFEEIDGLVEPVLFPDESVDQEEELANTGVLEQSYEDLLLEHDFSLEDDTDPSLDLFLPEVEVEGLVLPELGDPISLAQEDPSEAFDSMEELSHEQFVDDVDEPEESWVDSTNVFSPDAALLEAARGAYAEHVNESTMSMIEVPILEFITDEQNQAIEQDATGMFEVPAALLSQLRQSGNVLPDDRPPDALPGADDDDTSQGVHETAAFIVPPFEVDAFINADGFVVIPPGQAITAHLKPGMALRLLVQIKQE